MQGYPRRARDEAGVHNPCLSAAVAYALGAVLSTPVGVGKASSLLIRSFPERVLAVGCLARPRLGRFSLSRLRREFRPSGPFSAAR